MISNVGTITAVDQQACSDPGTNPRIVNICAVFLSRDVKLKPHYLSFYVSRNVFIVFDYSGARYQINWNL